jgi:integrase
LLAYRDTALLQIGYFGALRRSELVAIQYEDITWSEEGIEILIPKSKTDPTRSGQHVAIAYGNETLCPIATLETWLKVASIKSGCIFRRTKKGEQLQKETLSAWSVNFF